MKVTTVWTRLAQLVLAVNLLFFVGTSLVILFLLHTFQSLVQFVPFNRHYLDDAGIFQLAVSLGLFWALPAPISRVAHIWRITCIRSSNVTRCRYLSHEGQTSVRAPSSV